MPISVALCTFNGGRYLPEQLASLRQQTLAPHELVVCDDGSTDNTLDIVAAFQREVAYPVRIHRNTERMGSTRNFEQAIRLCSGDAIALCDQDDRWAPEKLFVLEQAFARNPEVGGIFSNAALMDGSGASIAGDLWTRFGFSVGLQQRFRGAEALRILTQRDVVTGCTLAFRTRLRDQVLPVGPGWVHDGWIAMMLAGSSQLVPLPEKLITYRLHAAQQIGAQETSLQSHLSTERDAAKMFHKRTAERFRSAAEQLKGLAPQTPAGVRAAEIVGARADFHKERLRLLELPRVQRLVPGVRLLRSYSEYEKGWLSLLRDVAH